MDLKALGQICRAYRVFIGFTQSDVAQDTHYCIENVSRFERGLNDNCRILMWYIMKGMLSDVESSKLIFSCMRGNENVKA